MDAALTITSSGVKKPLNPILGEYFTCHWDFDETPGSQAFYISEQTSHHPPKSSYFYMAPHHGIRIDGTLKPQSRFLGNSAASVMSTSVVVLRLLNRGATAGELDGGEKYILTQPNMYVRGILFGKMKYELGDHSYVKCSELDLVADIDFKVKGFFTGAYNAIGGQIKRESTGEVLYEITGSWSGEIFIKDCLVQAPISDGVKWNILMVTVIRLVRKTYFSTPQTRSLRHRSSGRYRNRMSASLRSYGDQSLLR